MANNTVFNTISRNKMPRTAFNLTHDVKTTLNMGDLVPIFLQEVVPGDRFRIRVETMIRMMPMLAPLMHRVNIWTHFFFVPYRLIWSDWEDFITGGEDGLSLPNHPKFTRATTTVLPGGTLGYGSLADYLGVPVKNLVGKSVAWSASEGFSQLPFRAYQLIYNEYYRDQNLSDPIQIPLGSNNMEFNHVAQPYSNTIVGLRKRAWEKDYFTSALPWTQRGPQMAIPLSNDRASVMADVNSVRLGTKRDGDNYDVAVSQTNLEGEELYTDLAHVTGSTINELRQAFQIQKWLERSARSGSRYVEFLQSFFNVDPQDSRLQRPEFLGGSKQPVMISEVLQTSESTQSSELGNFAGHGISTGSSARISRYFPEHGYVMGIMSVLPRTGYSQGLARHWTKFDKYDHYFKEFAHLGEQEIRNKELYWDPADPSYSNAEFGYTGRYNEYRYVPDRVHGEFLNTLDYWHLSRLFESGEEPTKPVLNQDFVSAHVSDRIFPVQDSSHKLLAQLLFDFQSVRPIPRYGTPAGI